MPDLAYSETGGLHFSPRQDDIFFNFLFDLDKLWLAMQGLQTHIDFE